MSGTVRFRRDWAVEQVGPLRAGGELRVEYAVARVLGASPSPPREPPRRWWAVTAHARFSSTGSPVVERRSRVDEDAVAFSFPIPGSATSVRLWFRLDDHADELRAWDSLFGRDFRFALAPPLAAITAHRAHRGAASVDGWPAEANEALRDPACLWRTLYTNRSIDNGCMKVIGHSPTARTVVTALVEFETSCAGSFTGMTPTSGVDRAEYLRQAQLDRGPRDVRVVHPPTRTSDGRGPVPNRYHD